MLKTSCPVNMISYSIKTDTLKQLIDKRLIEDSEFNNRFKLELLTAIDFWSLIETEITIPWVTRIVRNRQHIGKIITSESDFIYWAESKLGLSIKNFVEKSIEDALAKERLNNSA